MKITKKYLQNIIAKELQSILREQAPPLASAEQLRQRATARHRPSPDGGGWTPQGPGLTDKETDEEKSMAWSRLVKQFEGNAKKISERHGITKEQAMEVIEQYAYNKIYNPSSKTSLAGIVAQIKKETPAAAPAEPKAHGSLGKQQGMKAGLKGKYLDAYTAIIQGKTLNRQQRQNYIKNFLAKQQAGG